MSLPRWIGQARPQIDDTNPFVRARAAILRGDMPMIDISDALANMPGPRYLDIAHCSPQSNAELARAIAKHIQ
jgi:hypothetical protein